jgi:3-oxoacyl-[acyl-carrier protein] reductase
MKLSGKVAIVTGGSRGIGRAVCLAFAKEGARVVVVGRNEPRCAEVAAQISAAGGSAIGVRADVANEIDVMAMARTAQEHFGRIDILVNNAGVNLPYTNVWELSLDQWNWVVSTNLTGAFLCCKAVLPAMVSQQYGKIINVSSIGGRRGAAGRTPYRPTKAALINFTECLAAEVKQYGIDVNAVCPGPTDTDMMRDITGGNVPPNMMSPEDIAEVVMFLASDESRAITGTAVDTFGTANPIFGTSIDVAQRSR